MCLNNNNVKRMHQLVQNRRYFFGNKLLLTQLQESRNQAFLSFSIFQLKALLLSRLHFIQKVLRYVIFRIFMNKI
jgi:hypothetical protein